MDVGAWLKGLGLEEYIESFAENGVDLALLCELTNDDLKDLGVARLADRKRLFKGIDALLESERTGSTPTSPSTAPVNERRQVTVLFADLAGFTRLSNELDAEETHAILNRYFETVDGIVQAYGGTVDKHIGDNVMAVFGAPIAHTDDPQRAVRAASEIHQSMNNLSQEVGHNLAAHIGIASGQVVASTTGSDTHREYTMTGETVNLASRLDDLAKAGETLVSETVWRAVSRIAVCSSRGQIAVKGFDKEVEVWAVRDLAAVPEPAHQASIVGRRPELCQFTGLLDAALEQAMGHTLLVRGEPGIGKTRLIEEFIRIADNLGFAAHKALILDFGVGKGQDAIRGLVRSLLAVSDGDNENAKEAAARRARNANLVSKNNLVFLYDLLDVRQPRDLHSIFDAMDVETRRQGACATVAELIQHGASPQPLLIVVEDFHWADEIVLRHLTDIARVSAESPVVLVMTTRVEGVILEKEWLASLRGCPLTTIELQPLRPEEAMRLAAELAATDVGAVEAIVARAEGNPLYLEQLMQNLSDISAHELPDTIQGVVLARIDRLSRKDRDAIRAASVLGQRFSLPALQSLLKDPDYNCIALLEHRLVRPEGPDYLFAHALVREGVYGSLLKASGRDLHARAADFYAEHDKVLYAQHLDRASSADAPQAYLAAAREQTDGTRYEDALRLVRRALEIASSDESFELQLLEGETN